MSAEVPFPDYLAKRLPQVNAWIEDHAWRSAPDDALGDDLARYLYAPLAHFNAGGGKRARPVLALLGSEAVGGTSEAALAAGCAIELFQSAALVHDDIADEGTMRRGEPCLHVTYGTGLAINVGDAALVQVTDAILEDGELSEVARLRVLREFVAMERRTLEGQALDLGWARDGRWDLSPADYLTMATLKTAHYTCASPLVIGAFCGGGTHEQADALRAFGLDAGLAFQIQDDLLNLVGDADAQGKDLMSDITEGKRTLPVLYTLEKLAGARREDFLALVSSGTTDEADLRRAVSLMEETGALDHARDMAATLTDRAIGRLDSVKLDERARETLVSMAHFFVERVS